MSSKRPAPIVRYRSAKTGRFVSRAFALRLIPGLLLVIAAVWVGGSNFARSMF